MITLVPLGWEYFDMKPIKEEAKVLMSCYNPKSDTFCNFIANLGDFMAS
jgi:hypothetical protein